MAHQDQKATADRTALSTDAREALLDVGGEEPPVYEADRYLPRDGDEDIPVDYRPEDGEGPHHVVADVQDAFEDAQDNPAPAGYLEDCLRFETGFFHTEWLARDEAVSVVTALPEMPVFEFYPNRVADQIRNLPANALVAIAREVIDQRLVPAIYVWSNFPATTHLFAHASTNSEALYFDVGDRYPLVDESGVMEREHVLAAPRGWAVSRVLFGESH